MSRARGRRGGRHNAHGGGHEDGERWLLTYADMITLLMALFMVLFSISSVNISKIQALQKSLKAAFSPDNILPGGKDIAKQGSTASAKSAPASTEVQSIVPLSPHATSSPENSAAAASASASVSKAEQEQSSFERLKHQLDAYAASHGFAKDVNTTVQPRGLVIRVLTDRLLFPSGSATLLSPALPLLSEIAALVNLDSTHPVAIEGNTDNVPISGASFPSNWELSTARASMVVRFLIRQGVFAPRLSASGYADLRPIASNQTSTGRARNRRVEIVLQRMYGSSTQPLSEAATSNGGAHAVAPGAEGH
ncbi:MAG TPA: flagellar motor protein MotB [Solirubrobacteraceae bacterium]|jgi:chemotaxis protein MotB|nr:flagellar motor protein MotB [Solirubrobacteraceae bacterium]